MQVNDTIFSHYQKLMGISRLVVYGITTKSCHQQFSLHQLSLSSRGRHLKHNLMPFSPDLNLRAHLVYQTLELIELFGVVLGFLSPDYTCTVTGASPCDRILFMFLSFHIRETRQGDFLLLQLIPFKENSAYLYVGVVLDPLGNLILQKFTHVLLCFAQITREISISY